MNALLLVMAARAGSSFDLEVREGILEAVLHEPVGPVFPPDLHEELLEAAASHVTAEVQGVRLVGFDRDTGERVSIVDRLPLPDQMPHEGAYLAPADNPGGADGMLGGKAVYLSQCHGWIWNGSAFNTQRAVVHETVEDFHNPEGMNQYLTAYLENAGARVYTAKERDVGEVAVVVDDGQAGYTETGGGFGDGLAGYGHQSTYGYGTDPFNAGGTRTFSAHGGGIASWAPVVPEDGLYSIYVSWDSDPGNASDAHYRISHPGGTLDRHFDQRVHGSTWQYVERLWLLAGTSLTVELVGDSPGSGAMLSADAVRIGGGMGVISRGGQTTQRPRWEGGAVQGVQYLGAPPSVYDPYGDGDGSDPNARSRWADWEHPAGEDAVYLSWHSNAFNGSARGTSTYYAGGGSDSPDASACSSAAVTGGYTLASRVQTEIMAQIEGRWDSGWNDRGVNTACFAEIKSANNDEMPAVLVELAFHDNVDDAGYLKQPLFRRDSARGMARGIVRYFAEQDGISPVFQPEPPTHLSAVHDPAGGIRISWAAGPSGGTDGDAADGYLVFASTDGRSWNAGFSVTGTSTVVTPPFGARFWRVVAVNAGGQSFPSEVVGASHNADGASRVLVVGAFDRLDSGLLPREATSVGTVRRMNLDHLNDGAIIVPHGLGIVGAAWTFDSASDEAFESLDLSPYDVIVWATGEESTVDETFSDAQQALVQGFVASGGGLIASGAEVLWDLDERGSATDQLFAADVLGATMATDAASSTNVSGTGLLAGISLDFGSGAYPVEYPDTLASSRTIIATYGTGAEVAGVLGSGVAMFGFPLDAVNDPSVLIDLFAALLPEIGGEPPVNPPPVTPPPVTPPPAPVTPPPVTPPEPTDPVLPPEERPPATGRRIPLDELGGGCGCQQGPSPSGLWVGTLLLGGILRRRVR